MRYAVLELRAAPSLWQSQGKHQDAYDLLAPVYEWITEDFDPAELEAQGMTTHVVDASAIEVSRRQRRTQLQSSSDASIDNAILPQYRSYEDIATEESMPKNRLC